LTSEQHKKVTYGQEKLGEIKMENISRYLYSNFVMPKGSPTYFDRLID